MTTQTYPSGKVIGYAYDDKGELVSISIDGTPFISNIKTNENGLQSYEKNATDFQNFVYDANGNRLNQEQENNKTKLFTYALNSNILNSIKESNTTDSKTINYEYDKTGNIIKDDKHTYTYDSRNRLTAIDNNVTYQYNYDNKRVSKTVNGVKTYFIYDGHMLVGEYQLNLSDDSRQEYVYLNSTPIATLTPTETYRVYADHLDTSRRVATDDEDAEIMWKWESKPFGESEATGELTFNLRFPGQYFDNETQTHYNINRDYNPVTGRYIQSDPIGFDGGVNGFGYVGGRPIILVDKNGLYAYVIYINSWFIDHTAVYLDHKKTLYDPAGSYVNINPELGTSAYNGNYEEDADFANFISFYQEALWWGEYIKVYKLEADEEKIYKNINDQLTDMVGDIAGGQCTQCSSNAFDTSCDISYSTVPSSLASDAASSSCLKSTTVYK